MTFASHLRVTGLAALLVAIWANPGFAQTPQNPLQQACINRMNGALAGVWTATGKNAVACIKDGALGELSPPATTIDECIAMDPTGKIQKAKDKTVSGEERSCRFPPDFGFTHAATVNGAAHGEADALFRDLFGDDIDAAVARESVDGELSLCQQELSKAIGKCMGVRLKQFNRCKKMSIRSLEGQEPDVQTSEELEEACLTDRGDPATEQPDAKKVIAKACHRDEISGGKPKRDRIFTVLIKFCASNILPPAEIFPGCPFTENYDVFRTQCIVPRVACRTCRAIAAGDALSRDCDLFDNGAADGSCPPA